MEHTHGEVAKFIHSIKIVCLEAIVAVFFGPDTAYGWSLGFLSHIALVR